MEDPRVSDDEVRVVVVAEQEDLGRLELRVDVVDEPLFSTRGCPSARATGSEKRPAP